MADASTPSAASASRCSTSRVLPSESRSVAHVWYAFSPSVTAMTVTVTPLAVNVAGSKPAPRVSSSGCGATTSKEPHGIPSAEVPANRFNHTASSVRGTIMLPWDAFTNKRAQQQLCPDVLTITRPGTSLICTAQSRILRSQDRRNPVQDRHGCLVPACDGGQPVRRGIRTGWVRPGFRGRSDSRPRVRSGYSACLRDVQLFCGAGRRGREGTPAG